MPAMMRYPLTEAQVARLDAELHSHKFDPVSLIPTNAPPAGIESFDCIDKATRAWYAVRVDEWKLNDKSALRIEIEMRPNGSATADIIPLSETQLGSKP